LNTAINKLREALGDSADNPRFIETCHAVGTVSLHRSAATIRGNHLPVFFSPRK